MESVITTYDGHGRVSTVVAGTGLQARTTTYAYDAVTGFLKSVTDPLGRTWQYEQDLAGRTTRVILPDAGEVLAAYDEAGNRIALTPPGKPAHAFSYSAVDLQVSYTPPGGGGGSTTTWYLYDSERKLTRTTRPDGTITDMAYDGAGRLSAATMPGAAFSYAYSPVSGLLTGIATLDGSVIAYGYDGSLLTTTNWSGPIAGAVGKTFNADRLMGSISVNGQPVSFTYNADNLLTQAGAMSLTRSAQTGLISATHLGNVHDARGYNGFGEPATYSATFNAITLLAQTYTRDKAAALPARAKPSAA
ncbi:MAG: RHS repeat protein [Betaproteobacteria bacterium]|nr:RHS repeat protein [Betaproteobacteria bacterium]